MTGAYRLTCRDCGWSLLVNNEQKAKDEQINHELTNGHATDRRAVDTDGDQSD